MRKFSVWYVENGEKLWDVWSERTLIDEIRKGDVEIVGIKSSDTDYDRLMDMLLNNRGIYRIIDKEPDCYVAYIDKRYGINYAVWFDDGYRINEIRF